MVIISVAVSIRTTFFEESWVVHGPVTGLAGFGDTVSASATVFISVESETGRFATDNLSTVTDQSQFSGAVVVDAIGTGGLLATVLGPVTRSVKGLNLK